MTTEVSFLNAIRDAPDDDDLRLIFADWLEERDDPRGKLMRAQVLLRRAKRSDPRRSALRRETKRIYDQVKDWLDYVPGSGRVRLVRGLLHLIVHSDYLTTLLREQQTLSRVLPWLALLELNLKDLPGFDRLIRLLASGLLHTLTGLHLYGQTLSEYHLPQLVNSPAAPYWTSLSMMGMGIHDSHAALMADAPELSRLRHLGLNLNGLTPEGLRALTTSPVLTRLTSLDLSRNPFGADGASVLADAPSLRHLRVLQLYGTELGAAGVGHLVDSPHLSALRKLNLRGNRMGPEGIERLAASSGLGAMVELSLCRNNMGPVSFEALFRHAERWPNLRRLNVTEEELTDRTISALLASPLARTITHLDLRDNRISDVGATMIARSKRLRGLRRLLLGGNAISNEGARELARSPHLPRLRYLELRSNTLRKETVDLLRKRFGKRCWP